LTLQAQKAFLITRFGKVVHQPDGSRKTISMPLVTGGKAKPRAIWVLPVPDGPRAMIFSRAINIFAARRATILKSPFDKLRMRRVEAFDRRELRCADRSFKQATRRHRQAMVM